MFCAFPHWFNGVEDAAREVKSYLRIHHSISDLELKKIMDKYGVPWNENKTVKDLVKTM